MSDATAERAKAIARVKKLLALAGNNPSDAERASAMEKAQALLLDHLITEKELGHGDSESSFISAWKTTGRNGQWARRIAQSVGRLYLCGYVYTSLGKRVIHHFVGRETDAQIAQEITGWVVESVYRQGAVEMRRLGMDNTYWTGFVNAASLEIKRRVDALIAEKQTPSATNSRALVVLDLYAQAGKQNYEYIKTMGTKTELARPMGGRSSEGWRAGTAYGANVPLGRAIADGAKTKRIGNAKT